MLKRKYESDSESESNKADRHEDIRHTPVKMVVTIDEEGNLNMKLDGGSLIVARKALSLSSPVFHAMLGSKSKFQESANKTFDDDGIQVTSFPDDNYQAMITVTRIMHHQSHQVSNAMAFQHLYQVAVLCDKYDLKRCLGPWIDRWAEPYLDSYPLQGYEGWLFMSRVFGYGGLFKEMTRHLILNSEISEMGEVVIGKGHDIGERMSEPLMVQIAMAREETVFLMLDLHWQELCRLRDSNTTPVCKVGGINVAKCDAINLGCLYQCYPDLCDPRDTEKSYCKSVSSLAEGPKGILDLCGALVRKFGEHQPCAVGARLAAQAAELMKAVHGLDLGA